MKQNNLQTLRSQFVCCNPGNLAFLCFSLQFCIRLHFRLYFRLYFRVYFRLESAFSFGVCIFVCVRLHFWAGLTQTLILHISLGVEWLRHLLFVPPNKSASSNLVQPKHLVDLNHFREPTIAALHSGKRAHVGWCPADIQGVALQVGRRKPKLLHFPWAPTRQPTLARSRPLNKFTSH